MKKLLAVILSLTFAFSLAACKPDAPSQKESENTQIANPFSDCESLEDAEKIAGFSLSLSQDISDLAPQWTDEIVFRAVKDSMIEVIFSGEDKNLRIRKGLGKDDISGDYNEYEQVQEVSVSDISVTLKGNDAFSVAIWKNDGYSYAVTSSSGYPLEEMVSLVSEIA